MPAPEIAHELADRKRLLILQSDLHRALIGAEVARASAQLERADQWRTGMASHPWLLGGIATVAGFLGVRHWRSALKWLPAGLAAWRWYDKLKLR